MRAATGSVVGAVVGTLAIGLALLAAAGAAGAEGPVLGGEVTAPQAQEVARRADPALLAPSSSVRLEGQPIQPAIGDGGEELSSTGALTSSTISKEARGQFAVDTADGELSLTPLGTSPAAGPPTVVDGAAALFADTWPSTDTIVRPDALGATAILQLRSPQAPGSFSWEVGLGPGQRLRQLAAGGVAVVRAPVGLTLAGALPSSALELAGESGIESGVESEGAGEEGIAAESRASEDAPLASLPPAPRTLTPAPRTLTPPPRTSTPAAGAAAGLSRPRDTRAQAAAAAAAVGAAESQTGGTALMVMPPPTATDARGDGVPASFSVAGETITASVASTATTVFPVMVAMTVAAPSDRASAARAQQLAYGLSDQRLGVFGPSFDPRLLEGPLHFGVARLVVPYDTALASTERREEQEKEEGKLQLTQNERLTEWLRGVGEVSAGGEHLRPYVTLWSRGCLEGGACEAPPIERYRRGVEALIERYMQATDGLPAVTMWGAWNEPDGSKAPLRAAKAAELWQAAHSAMVNLHCRCTMVAGEFSEFEQRYISRYKKFMVNHHLRPHAWGLHDYHDLVEVPGPRGLLGRYENHSAEEYAKITSTRLGHPRIWLSEQGVELRNAITATRLQGKPILQRAAAEDFLRLADTSRRVELIDYYQYGAPEPTKANPHPEAEHVFDSAVLDEKGNPRAAYCVLAFAGHVCPPTAETGP